MNMFRSSKYVQKKHGKMVFVWYKSVDSYILLRLRAPKKRDV